MLQAKANDSGLLTGMINSSGSGLVPADVRNWCNIARAFEGNLVIDFSINALRSQPSQFINISADGRWRGIGKVRACPS
jgi:hypothetical protein